MKRRKMMTLILLLRLIHSDGQVIKTRSFSLGSPQGNINVQVEAGNQLRWSVSEGTQPVLAESRINLQINGGEILGEPAEVLSADTKKIENEITAFNYKKSSIADHYNQLTL